jgi:uncharacterized membrane protein
VPSVSARSGEALGAVSRLVALATTLGAGVGLSVALLVFWREMPSFVLTNTAPHPGLRLALLLGVVTGGGLGVLAALGALEPKRLRSTAEQAERWLWFVSPALVAPAVTLALNWRIWSDRHLVLLVFVAATAMTLEWLVALSLDNMPPAVHARLSALGSWVGRLPPTVRRRAPSLVVALAAAAWAVLVSLWLVRWHHKLQTHNFDLSINTNLMYRGLHGHFLESTVAAPTDPGAYIANHAKIGAYLFLPIFALHPRPETLLVVQAVLLAAGALPLFLFARRYHSGATAAVIAIGYLCYYPLHGAAFSEFQGLAVAAFFILAAVAAAEAHRWVWFGLSAGAAILMREDVSIGMAVVGLFLLLSKHRPRAGLLLALGALGYFALLRFFLMPRAGSWPHHQDMYRDLWADDVPGFSSVVKTLLTNPAYAFSRVVVERKVVYLLHLLVPLAFLPLRRARLLTALIPGSLITLTVTNYVPPITFSFHYVMHWVPYLFLAAVLALRGRRAAVFAFGFAIVTLGYNYGAFSHHGDGLTFKAGYSYVDFRWAQEDARRYDQLESVIALIPPGASVAATESLGPHASSRMTIYTMRAGPHAAEYILASFRDSEVRRTPQLYRALVRGEYGVLERTGDFALMRRGHDPSANAALITEWGLGESP